MPNVISEMENIFRLCDRKKKKKYGSKMGNLLFH